MTYKELREWQTSINGQFLNRAGLALAPKLTLSDLFELIDRQQVAIQSVIATWDAYDGTSAHATEFVANIGSIIPDLVSL